MVAGPGPKKYKFTDHFELSANEAVRGSLVASFHDKNHWLDRSWDQSKTQSVFLQSLVRIKIGEVPFKYLTVIPLTVLTINNDNSLIKCVHIFHRRRVFRWHSLACNFKTFLRNKTFTNTMRRQRHPDRLKIRIDWFLKGVKTKMFALNAIAMHISFSVNN